MTEIDRRKFLKLVGAGSAAVAAATMAPAAVFSSGPSGGNLALRAVAGLPQGPVTSYATYVLEGHVNVAAQSGVIAKTVYAGPPEAMSNIALPGLSRIFRVTKVRDLGGSVNVSVVVDDRSQLRASENPNVEILIDRTNRQVQAPFMRNEISLRLDQI